MLKSLEGFNCAILTACRYLAGYFSITTIVWTMDADTHTHTPSICLCYRLPYAPSNIVYTATSIMHVANRVCLVESGNA